MIWNVSCACVYSMNQSQHHVAILSVNHALHVVQTSKTDVQCAARCVFGGGGGVLVGMDTSESVHMSESVHNHTV